MLPATSNGNAPRPISDASVFVSIDGATHYLWRAVDQEGNVLDILVVPVQVVGGITVAIGAAGSSEGAGRPWLAASHAAVR